jgi:hypothetical protein
MRFAPLALCALLPLAHLQAEEPTAPPPRPNCDAAEHRAFDFWIGDWDVSSNGKPAGRNTISVDHKGCTLREEWRGAGSHGSSLNAYDRRSKQWKQFWIDDSGMLLELVGGLKDGNMVMATHINGPQGSATHRITWTPNPDGSVRQHWQSLADGSDRWTTVFDGLYVRRKD